MTDKLDHSVHHLPTQAKLDLASTIENIGSIFMRQGQSLERLSQSFDHDSYLAALQILMHTRGHLIVIGMGKSGHVGRKISATFASTGTPSFFLHPAEASHGDLGMVTARDTLLLISFSGETQEIVQLLPSLKAFGNRIIAITGNKNSTLGRIAEVVLEVPVAEEVCPNNLVPTTSILVTTAIGDALALSMMEAYDFRAKDFARFHPGGSLGRRLLVRVGEEMLTTGVPVVDPDIVLLELAAEMAGGPAGMAVVVSDRKPIGVVSKGQLGVALRVTRRLGEVTARQCMSQDFPTIEASRLVDDAETMLRQQDAKFLVVVDAEGNYLGLYRQT